MPGFFISGLSGDYTAAFSATYTTVRFLPFNILETFSIFIDVSNPRMGDAVVPENMHSPYPILKKNQFFVGVAAGKIVFLPGVLHTSDRYQSRIICSCAIIYFGISQFAINDCEDVRREAFVRRPEVGVFAHHQEEGL